VAVGEKRKEDIALGVGETVEKAKMGVVAKVGEAASMDGRVGRFVDVSGPAVGSATAMGFGEGGRERAKEEVGISADSRVDEIEKVRWRHARLAVENGRGKKGSKHVEISLASIQIISCRRVFCNVETEKDNLRLLIRRRKLILERAVGESKRKLKSGGRRHLRKRATLPSAENMTENCTVEFSRG